MTDQIVFTAAGEPPDSVLVVRDTEAGNHFKYLVRCGDGWTWSTEPEPISDTGQGCSWESNASRARGDLVAYCTKEPDDLWTRIRNLEEALRQSSPNTSRGGLLHEASDLIHGDRNKTYGKPTENFDRTAALWNVQLGHKLRDGEKFTATDVALLMVQLKMARTVTQPKRDNFVDAAGYLACGWECVEDERGKAA